MNKSTLSILMAAMMAASGFAAAQNAPAMAGTQGGSGPSPAETAAPGNMPNKRADVKAQINTNDIKSGTQGGEGPVRGAPAGSSGDVPPNTRAGVKADINNTPVKAGIQGGSGSSPDMNMNTKNTGASASTMAERKAKRANRKAAAKAKADAKMSAGTSMTKPDMPMKDGKAQ